MIGKLLPRLRDSQKAVVLYTVIVSLGIAWALKSDAARAGSRVGDVCARRFVLVDSRGRPRAALGMVGGDVALCLYDQNGRRRITLGVVKEGPALALQDEKEQVRVTVALAKDIPLVTFSDWRGKLRVVLGLSEGEPTLQIYDRNGRLIRTVP